MFFKFLFSCAILVALFYVTTIFHPPLSCSLAVRYHLFVFSTCNTAARYNSPYYRIQNRQYFNATKRNIQQLNISLDSTNQLIGTYARDVLRCSRYEAKLVSFVGEVSFYARPFQGASGWDQLTRSSTLLSIPHRLRQGKAAPRTWVLSKA